MNAFRPADAKKAAEVQEKVKSAESTKQIEEAVSNSTPYIPGYEKNEPAITAETEVNVQEKEKTDPSGLTDEEMGILKTIRARQMLNFEEQLNIDSFGSNAINGYAGFLKRGSLSLYKVDQRGDRQLSNGIVQDVKATPDAAAWEHNAPKEVMV